MSDRTDMQIVKAIEDIVAVVDQQNELLENVVNQLNAMVHLLEPLSNALTDAVEER